MHFSDLSLWEHLHLVVSSMVPRGNSPLLDHVRKCVSLYSTFVLAAIAYTVQFITVSMQCYYQ